MLCILSNKRDPYYNLAAEEYLLRNTGADACILWQSKPAVIIGKHQNVYSEINYKYARKHNILIARRITGGGTVFHDSGNLNFSFIRNGDRGRLVDFKKYIQPILAFLKSNGIDAYPGPKNEILAGGKKISGNAEHIYKNRVLHHGTLLFNTDLVALNKVIERKEGVYIDKAIQSNRSSVANLKDFFPGGMTVDLFTRKINNFLKDYFAGQTYVFRKDEEKTIRHLADSKFLQWEWIYGWSPDYEFRNEIETGQFKASIYMKTHRGIIQEFLIESDSLSATNKMKICDDFKNVPHSYDTIAGILKDHGFLNEIREKDRDDLVFSFF